MHPWHDVPIGPGAPHRYDELSPHRLEELKRFFQDDKVLERKEVEVQEFGGPRDAVEAIREAMELYRKRFPG